jgi:hypothetical protein
MAGYNCILFKTLEGSIILHTHDTISSEKVECLMLWYSRTCELCPPYSRCFDMIIKPFPEYLPVNMRLLFARNRRVHFHNDFSSNITRHSVLSVADLDLGDPCLYPGFPPLILQ